MIEILSSTDKNPLEKVGMMAGICWDSPTDDKDKNIKRAKDCFTSGHGRTMEFINVEFVISEYSARCLREVYTHIAGSPTRLQSSTRYVDYNNFGFYIPNYIKNPTGDDKIKAAKEYQFVMDTIKNSYKTLVECGMSKEDAANILPLGMYTKVVMKCNLRMLVNFFGQRLCNRAYVEIRQLANELKETLSSYSEEWKWICDNYALPKCKQVGYCIESKSCGLVKSKEEVLTK